MNEQREKDLYEEIKALRDEIKRLQKLLFEASERLSAGKRSDELYCEIQGVLGNESETDV